MINLAENDYDYPEESHKKTKQQHKLVALLFIFIALTASFAFAANSFYEQAVDINDKYILSQLAMQSLKTQVRATSQYVTNGNLTLSFTPYTTTMDVPGDAITYLMGFVSVSNLTKIIARPLTLSMNFMLNASYPRYGTTVTHQYNPSSVNSIPPTVDEISLPWGAYPVTISGFRAGEQIKFHLVITARADWLENTVTTIKLETDFVLNIISSSPNALPLPINPTAPPQNLTTPTPSLAPIPNATATPKPSVTPKPNATATPTPTPTTSPTPAPSTPQFSTLITTNKSAGAPVTLSVNVTSTTSIKSYQYSWNNTGVWTDSPFRTITGNTLTYNGTWINKPSSTVAVIVTVRDTQGHLYPSTTYYITLE